MRFAYNHNVDIGAWVDEQHEQADHLFNDMDDYEAAMMHMQKGEEDIEFDSFDI